MNISTLKNQILFLEMQQSNERLELQEEFLGLYESLKPINLIKNTFKELSVSQDIKDNLIGTAMGLAAGIVTKTLIVGDSQNPVKKVIADLVQLEVSNVVSNNAESIQNLIWKGLKLINKFKNGF